MSWTKQAKPQQEDLPMEDMPLSDNDVLFKATVRDVREGLTIYLGRELSDDELKKVAKVLTMPQWHGSYFTDESWQRVVMDAELREAQV